MHPVSWVAADDRWEYQGVFDKVEARPSVRWLERLLARPERKEKDKPVLRYPEQIAAYEQHLARREVRATMGIAVGFFLCRVLDEDPPASLVQYTVHHPPLIEPGSGKPQ